MDMEDKETAPGTVLLAVDVARRQAELRRRSVIMTEDPVEAAEWLRTYRHPMPELISIGPWASYSAFNQGAGVDLPRLLLSDRVRSACAEEVAGLDYAAQQAKYLFSYEDAAEWIEANVETRVMSVVVPLSIFATDPDALRAEFEEEKRLRFTNVKTNEGAAKPRRILARWNVVKNLAKEAREAIGNWSSDYAAEKVRQQVAWPVPPSMEVDFPGCVFARYRTSAEIEPTRQRTHHDPLYGHGCSPRDRAQQAVLQAALHAGTSARRPSKLARLRDRTGRRDEHSEGGRAARRELHQARRLASFARGRRLVRRPFGPARREAQLRHADSARSFEGEAQARRLSPACDSLAGLPAWGFGSRSARAIIIV